MRRRCSIVDLSSEEFKLEYTTAFEDYKALFEDYMEGFITRDCSSSVRNFYEALKRQMDKDENSSEAVFGQILIAVTDFDIFMTMMREAKQSGETDSRK